MPNRVRGIMGAQELVGVLSNTEEESPRLEGFGDRIINSIPTALAVLRGNEGIIVLVNQAFGQAFSFDKEVVEGRCITEILALDGLEEVIRKSFQRGEPALQREMRRATPEGRDRYYMVSAVPMHARAEAKVGREDEVLLLVNDITEQRHNQERLQETTRLASVHVLAAGVAHELNNSLAGVLGFSQLMMSRELSPSAMEDMEKIIEEAQRASKVVQHLLSTLENVLP